MASSKTNQNTITILTPDRPYACTHCHQTFSRTHNLKSHLATHSTTRPFQCETCHHYFRRQHDLKRHQKLHTGERPYVCGNCRRSFSRLDALNRHLRVDGGTACHSNRKSSNKIPKKMEHLSSHVSLPPLRLHLYRILPPLTFQEQEIKCLEQENASLRKEMQQLLSNRTRVHELEVENHLLRSFIQDQHIY
ncbi:hypothetical protein EDC96DRAFT_273330 [Choanephora cucurbitarum]|nr:hypothetical protein EDC96DRAFT_273330 [Choanephora cucurbitarum]